MIDGIKLCTEVASFEGWRRGLPIDFFGQCSVDTMQMRVKSRRSHSVTTYRGRLGVYDITAKEVTPTNIAAPARIYIEVSGSVHKGYYGGCNVEPFSIAQALCEICYLQQSLNLPDSTKITRLEIGVNVDVPFSPIQFLDNNLVAYKYKQFSKYHADRAGAHVGYEKRLSQYSVKLYDKGKQSGRSDINMLRLEIAFKKMQPLTKFGIKTLADLRKGDKVVALCRMLPEVWDSIIVSDCDIKLESLNEKDARILLLGDNPRSWEQLKKKLHPEALSRKLSAFRHLISTHGAGHQQHVRQLICKEIGEAIHSGHHMQDELIRFNSDSSVDVRELPCGQLNIDAVQPIRLNLGVNFLPLGYSKHGGVKCDDFTIKIKGKNSALCLTEKWPNFLRTNRECELLSFFENIEYPDAPIQLSPGVIISNPCKFIRSHVDVLLNQSDARIRVNYSDRLETLQQILARE